MSQYTSIQKYNNYLIENKINIDIIAYVKEINKIKYNIDISFIDEFIELVNRDECCIHHDMLQKYGVCSLIGGTSDIKKMLDKNEMVENEDYNLRNVSEVRKNRGSVIKNEYYLHPRAFKIFLMRSLKTKIYAKYYLLLEEAIKYFNDYQHLLKENYVIKLKEKIKNNNLLIKEKDDKIDSLENKLDDIIKDNKELLLNNKELLENNKEIIKRNKKMEAQLNEALERLEITNDKLDDANEELENTNEKLDNTDKTLNLVSKKLDIAVEDRVVKTKKTTILEYFVIMKNPSIHYKYYVIRGQKRYLNKKKEELEGYIEIKTIKCCPNANILWNLLKEKLKDKLDYMGNKINLLNITENEFLKNVDDIYNERKNIKIN